MTFPCDICYTVYMGRGAKYDPDAKLAAERLRSWRMEYGVTQEELAAICKVSRGTVIRWEDPGSEYSPGITHLIRIGRQLPNLPTYGLVRSKREDL